LDIPLQATEKTRFQAQWSDLAWKQWKLLPGAEHFSGSLNGSVEHGELRAHMAKALMPYAGVVRAPPWSPDVASLNGIIKSHLGKGQFTDLSTGHAGQLLRLLSVDALLRKLRFDFSDTFSEGFYFDSINSTAWIK
ncbi:AsmA-like C-terminal region-containing protein, partial [Escherichia coli]|uniref:YhdP family protein n=1 Tax=Escherichia coli TaxID=562 RepID=UPI003C30283B